MACYLKFKAGVIVPKSAIIAVAFLNAANELALPVDQLVTSGNDSMHGHGSKHYDDHALDFRTKHLKRDDKRNLVKAVKRRLGRDYDVLLEDEGEANEHLHVEFDPKA